MAKMNVKRVTLGSGINIITFPETCGKWLVKNFTSNDIFVSFENDFINDEAIKIEKGMGQIVIGNEQLEWSDVYKTNSIYIKGSGEVEVQQLCFK